MMNPAFAITRYPPSTTPWHFLALSDAELERADLVAMNLSVARGIPALKDLDVRRYCKQVDDWTQQFAQTLPSAEARFRQTPERWKNDIRFFRIGMLQGFLGHEIGIRYNEEQKVAQEVSYTNPGDLFLHGLIDTKNGTCGNMPTLHVAMSRRLGWPVSLACAKSHFMSRFDDGEVIYNIEATSMRVGSFCAEADEFYIEKDGLPKRAIACGSDLRKLTAREMMGAFFSLRARHHRDCNRSNVAEVDYCLARVLFPEHRATYREAVVPMFKRGLELFEPNELGHPRSFGLAINEAHEIFIRERALAAQTKTGELETMPPTQTRSPEISTMNVPMIPSSQAREQMPCT